MRPITVLGRIVTDQMRHYDKVHRRDSPWGLRENASLSVTRHYPCFRDRIPLADGSPIHLSGTGAAEQGESSRGAAVGTMSEPTWA